MASTYSTNLAIELIGTGDQAGSWGNTTNTNLGTLIEQAISGYVTQAVSTGTDTTITIPNGATGVARNMYIELTGTGGTNTNLIVPANKKLYFIFNNTSSGQVTVKVSGQTGVSVPNKAKMILVSNGTDIVDATNYIGNISAASANITVLTSASATITNLIATSASITTLTNNPTFGAGTANGVLYLNGSKVATSGSALVFDGTNLGIGVTPSYKLDVLGSGAAAAFRINNATAGKSAMLVQSNGATAGIIGLTGFVKGDSSTNLGFFAETGLDLRFYTNGSATEKAVIDTSGNLGIGTASPAYRLHVVGGAAIANRTTSDTPGNISLGVLSTASVATFGWRTDTSNNLHFDIYNGASWSAALTTSLSGNLGLGATPSAWTSITALQVGPLGAISGNSSLPVVVSANSYATSAGWAAKYITSGYATAYLQYLGEHRWLTAPSWNGTGSDVVSFTQAMTLDASGNLGVGTTSPAAKLHVAGTTGEAIIQDSDTAKGSNPAALLSLWGSDARAGYVGYPGDSNMYINQINNNAMLFLTNNTERARITAGGYFKASNDGTYFSTTGTTHEFRNSAGDNHTLVVHNTASTLSGSGARGIYINYTASPNATDRGFVACFDGNGANERATIRSNGGLANYQSNNVDISDARTKKDIAPAASMWGKIGALEIVTYKYNDQTHDDVNLGVIAQQVESVEPVWVDADGFGDTPEDGVPLKTVYTKDITFAAIKALQEAMARIEQLEADMAALKASA